jgi:hypothetical protein
MAVSITLSLWRTSAYLLRTLFVRRSALKSIGKFGWSAHHGRMCDQQLDLFSSSGIQAERPLPQSMGLRPRATALDDQALIGAADSIALATEAGRRRLATAIPSLETYADVFPALALTVWCRSRPQRFEHSL